MTYKVVIDWTYKLYEQPTFGLMLNEQTNVSSFKLWLPYKYLWIVMYVLTKHWFSVPSYYGIIEDFRSF